MTAEVLMEVTAVGSVVRGGLVAQMTEMAGGLSDEEVRDGFLAITDRLEGLVRYLAHRAHVDDEDEVVASWKERAWRAYGRLARENAAARATGKPEPHTIGAYLKRIAVNLLGDMRREVERERRALGVREVGPRADERRLVELDVEVDAERSEVRGIDGYVDERAADPEETAIRSETERTLWEGIRALPREEQRAVVRWMHGGTDGEEAAADGTTPVTAWRRRQRGMAKLREMFRAAGWAIKMDRRRRRRVTSRKGR